MAQGFVRRILALFQPRRSKEVIRELKKRIEDSERTVEKLRASEEQFRLLVEGVQDYAIYLLDPHGFVATWNSGAERIKGYRAEEILERSQLWRENPLAHPRIVRQSAKLRQIGIDHLLSVRRKGGESITSALRPGRGGCEQRNECN